MNKNEQMRLWKHVWKRPGMYVGDPSARLLITFWYGFQSGQDPAEKSASLFRNFEGYVQKKMNVSFSGGGMRAALLEKFGSGKTDEKRAVDYLSKLAHAYAAKRFGSKAYSKCDT